jgi:hypothetical protein
MATLTVMPAQDGSSLLRVDLNNTAGVERVRIRLNRPDLGEDLLDTRPSGDGDWILNGNEIAVPPACGTPTWRCDAPTSSATPTPPSTSLSTRPQARPRSCSPLVS